MEVLKLSFYDEVVNDTCNKVLYTTSGQLEASFILPSVPYIITWKNKKFQNMYCQTNIRLKRFSKKIKK